MSLAFCKPAPMLVRESGAKLLTSFVQSERLLPSAAMGTLAATCNRCALDLSPVQAGNAPYFISQSVGVCGLRARSTASATKPIV